MRIIKEAEYQDMSRKEENLIYDKVIMKPD